MCEKSWVFNSESVPTYRTRTFSRKAYRTNVPYPYLYKKDVPYFLAKIEAYRTYVPYRTVILIYNILVNETYVQHFYISDQIWLLIFGHFSKFLSFVFGKLAPSLNICFKTCFKSLFSLFQWKKKGLWHANNVVFYLFCI